MTIPPHNSKSLKAPVIPSPSASVAPDARTEMTVRGWKGLPLIILELEAEGAKRNNALQMG